MNWVEILWRLLFGNRFFLEEPAPPITGLFLSMIMTIFFAWEKAGPTGDEEVVYLHSDLPQYLRLITQLVELEPDSQPFLLKANMLRHVYQDAVLVSHNKEDYWENFYFCCLQVEAYTLDLRAEVASLAPKLDIFLSNHQITAPVTKENGLDLITSNLMSDISNTLSSIKCHFVGTQIGCVCSSGHAIKEEDQIWLLHRLRLPAVLRPLEDGSFEFLGVVSLCLLDSDVNLMDKDYMSRETKQL